METPGGKRPPVIDDVERSWPWGKIKVVRLCPSTYGVGVDTSRTRVLVDTETRTCRPFCWGQWCESRPPSHIVRTGPVEMRTRSVWRCTGGDLPSPGLRDSSTRRGPVVSAIHWHESWTLYRDVTGTGDGGRLYRHRMGYQDMRGSHGFFVGTSNGDHPYGGPVDFSERGRTSGLFIKVPGEDRPC